MANPCITLPHNPFPVWRSHGDTGSCRIKVSYPAASQPSRYEAASQPASISVGRLPPLQAPVFRVLDYLLLSTDSTARALFVFRSIGWTDRLSFSVSGWKSGLVRLSVYGKLHYPSSVLCLVPRDRGYVQSADRKPVLPGRGCLLPCASGPVCCCRTRYAC
jgi:hypothetical protein